MAASVSSTAFIRDIAYSHEAAVEPQIGDVSWEQIKIEAINGCPACTRENVAPDLGGEAGVGDRKTPTQSRGRPRTKEGVLMNSGLLVLPMLAVIAACGGENTDSNVTAPGRERTAKTKALETGADLMQDKAPIRTLNAYMDGFHFYNGDLKAQMEAHHYCGHLNEDVIQCVIFDGNVENAKIMGLEYIVSRTLFENLPAEEKHLWHSHVHEVRSGQLIAPGIPEVAEHEFMEKIANTYGKTWHTWHTDQNRELPLGTPMLMMGFTQDGQIDEQLVSERDQRFGVSSAGNRQKRADIDYPSIDREADAWQKGIVVQLEAHRQQADGAAAASRSRGTR